jgi:hypothetical protein
MTVVWLADVSYLRFRRSVIDKIEREYGNSPRERTIAVCAHDVKSVLRVSLFYSAIFGPRAFDRLWAIREAYIREPGEIYIQLVTGVIPENPDAKLRRESLGRAIALAAAHDRILAIK